MRSFFTVVMIPALLISVVAISVATEVRAAKRVALVIGNSAYQHTRVLPNPKNDAVAIAEAFKRIGFDKVTLKLDQDYTSLRRVLRDFGSSVEGADVAIVYYAGHGLELGGQNYLVPTDAKLLSDRDLEFEAVKLSTILRQVKPARQLRMVILDACRNNPLGSTMKLSQGASRSVSRGLSRIEPEGDVLVAYAAKHGTVASDGNGNHSPYTAALLKHLETPGLDVGFMFRRVRSDVLTATKRVQEPFIYGSLGRESVFLVPPTASASAKAVPAPSTIRPSAVSEAWSIIKDTRTADDLLAFMKRFPDSFYADLARSRLKKLREQDVAVGVFPKTPKPTVGQKSKTGREFQDCPQCPKMVVVPAGSFTMGSPASERNRERDEGPQRRITISQAFAVGKFEVTFAEWDACVSAGGCSHRPDDLSWGRGRRPVINVSWEDAKTYVGWLSRKTGKTYRLLSEAEWEYAARAGTTTPFSTGLTIIKGQANFGHYLMPFAEPKRGRKHAKTVTVGSFAANGFGLHDMHGNIAEWVEDCWKKSYAGAPSDGQSRTQGDWCLRSIRGGTWWSMRSGIRSADRIGAVPENRTDSFGFRVARTLAP